MTQPGQEYDSKIIPINNKENSMDQQKIGSFLKELRKEKSLTQEQLAEKLYVSRRTVSRWETGNNLPDLPVLIEIADLNEVDLRELLEGERRAPAEEGTESPENSTAETAVLIAEKAEEEKANIRRRFHYIFIAGGISFALYLISTFLAPENTGHLFDFLQGASLGISFGAVLLGILITGKNTDAQLAKIREFRARLTGRKSPPQADDI